MFKTRRLKVEVINKVMLKSAVPALGRLNQEDPREFETTLAYRVRPCLTSPYPPKEKEYNAKFYYKTVVIKTVWFWLKDTDTGQQMQ